MAGDEPKSELTACSVCGYSSTINPITAFLLESPLVPKSLVENILESLPDSLSGNLFNRASHVRVSMRELYSRKLVFKRNRVFDVKVLINGKSEFVEAVANRRF